MLCWIQVLVFFPSLKMLLCSMFVIIVMLGKFLSCLVLSISLLLTNKVILVPSCSCCRDAVNVVPMSGSERVLEVHFLHLIRVDYSVPQPCSRQSHTKGGPGPVCTGALWSEGSRISLHTDRSKPACQPPHTLSFHFSLIGLGVEGRV